VSSFDRLQKNTIRFEPLLDLPDTSKWHCLSRRAQRKFAVPS
jgi:hypothetical protein